jgi:hypothetical protein
LAFFSLGSFRGAQKAQTRNLEDEDTARDSGFASSTRPGMTTYNAYENA